MAGRWVMPLALALAASAVASSIDAAVVAVPLAPAAGAAVPTAPAARNAEEAAARARLEAIQTEQRRIEAERDDLGVERTRLVAALKAAELAISAATRRASALNAAAAARADDVAALTVKRERLFAKRERERQALAALVRSIYVERETAAAAQLLSADDLAEARALADYAPYIARARRVRIDALIAALDELKRTNQALIAAVEALAAERAALDAERQALDVATAERSAVLTALDGTLADQAAALRALAKDAAALDGLIARLTDAIADVPIALGAAAPLDGARGRLPWPADGAIAAGFGDGGGKGVRIAAAAGSAVRAIAHGRVAYADWMRGYGLIAIVDHGSGWMSLYANNRALTRGVGEWVEAGDALAEAGAGGNGVAAGLYFELRKNGAPLDPARWLGPR